MLLEMMVGPRLDLKCFTDSRVIKNSVSFSLLKSDKNVQIWLYYVHKSLRYTGCHAFFVWEWMSWNVKRNIVKVFGYKLKTVKPVWTHAQTHVSTHPSSQLLLLFF